MTHPKARWNENQIKKEYANRTERETMREKGCLRKRSAMTDDDNLTKKMGRVQVVKFENGL